MKDFNHLEANLPAQIARMQHPPDEAEAIERQRILHAAQG